MHSEQVELDRVPSNDSQPASSQITNVLPSDVSDPLDSDDSVRDVSITMVTKVVIVVNNLTQRIRV